MRCVFALVLVANALLGQTGPQARTISGVVLDSSGKPIEGARIEHTGTKRAYATGMDGRFELVTEAPAVVVRKVGFQSYFLRTDGATGVRITLEPAHPAAGCTLDSLPGHTVNFSHDVDYDSSLTIVQTKNGPAALLCGNGALWSGGIPSDSLVWQSVNYSESVNADYGGVVDARGRTRDGKYWRYRGILGSSCSYEKVDLPTATALDCLMGMTPGR
ncbi:MAG TPA: carboxypeptidase regulatory-like domain-containing protein [Bryobacteraceae bacterium]|nr:carboxypeptidase regulatory-like domain-containing protein [Bryobacteraceae bacterium]